MKKVLDYTNKVDAMVVVHTQSIDGMAAKIEYTGDDMYTGYARKLGLIDRKTDLRNHYQVHDFSKRHHTAHAALAFYHSGFEDAVAVVADGAGSCFFLNSGEDVWEVESIYDCSYKDGITAVFKHMGSRHPIPTGLQPDAPGGLIDQEKPFMNLVSDHAGITKSYEAVTEYCGFSAIEAGKTMGLFPYGKPSNKLPSLMDTDSKFMLTNRNTIVPTYPNSAIFNAGIYDYFDTLPQPGQDLTLMENRRDAAYWIQQETQQAMLNYILTACEMTGKKKVVLSGGYGLNCVANYWYLTELNKRGIELYVEPISNDGGTAIGAALLYYYETSKDTTPRQRQGSLYLGPKYDYTNDDFVKANEKYKNAEITDNVEYADIIKLLRSKNIVTMYQGRCENGPRALGNRSILFDPTFKDGKDYVNMVKRREYFRPFAASVLEEDAKEWFDLRGMDKTPHMMYAVNCQEGVAEKVPSVIHEDGTCRIQTVSKEENKVYYELISEFKKETGVPLLFNTSFNLGGEPLVETLEDAFWTLDQSDLEYCYFPEYKKLVKIPNTQK